MNLAEGELRVGRKTVKLTNLHKPFWPALGLSKGDLLTFYVNVSQALLPHLEHRAMVMKRYPNGAAGPFFFMKRTPSPKPDWLQTCAIEHASGNVIDFPMIQDVAALMWVVNLGCIDLNQWYSRCDDVDRPDYFHFDLDPGPGAPFEQVLESALLVRDALKSLKMPSYPKTSGSKGIHVCVPLKRGPRQKEVWTFTKAFAIALADPIGHAASHRIYVGYDGRAAKSADAEAGESQARTRIHWPRAWRAEPLEHRAIE